ncbi:MAG: putative porin [Aquabacterium sp.]|nr:putative porin [Aquabacterium sp.]
MLLRPTPRRRWPGAALALAAWLACMPAALAQAAPNAERESLETLRQTTLSLIELLVQNGTLPRDKADALLAEARRRGEAAAATPGTWGAAPAAAAATAATTVRVPYMPQVVRDQIRNEVREEVIARARIERWGVPNATAEWTDRIAIEGDLRVRVQQDAFGKDNPAPFDLLLAAAGGLTRVPDLAAGDSTNLPLANTQDDRNRLRLRARLGINAKVSDGITVGLRLATGSATDRVSTNQTLGQNFNRYQFLLDRAYLQVEPTDGLRLLAGRMPNPWFSTDLVWSDNLNFEGVSAGWQLPSTSNAAFRPYATVGWFPVREDRPPKRGRQILGLQVGAQWEWSPQLRLKFGLAHYDFRHFEGQVDNDYSAQDGPGRSYGQYEYEAGLRQRGNTLFLTNSPLQITNTRDAFNAADTMWGLAARFQPLVLTAAAQFSHFAPVFVGVSGELVRNQAYDRQRIGDTKGVWIDDARVFGVGLRTTVGAADVRQRGDWQLSLGWRWLGSDAVPDAFVDSDLGGGGTNLRGLQLGLAYGVARDSVFNVRWLSARTISSPTVRPGLATPDRFSLDNLQVDMHVRF